MALANSMIACGGYNDRLPGSNAVQSGSESSHCLRCVPALDDLSLDLKIYNTLAAVPSLCACTRRNAASYSLHSSQEHRANKNILVDIYVVLCSWLLAAESIAISHVMASYHSPLS